MAGSQEFLAKIKLVLDNAEVTQGLRAAQQQVNSFPWNTKEVSSYEQNIRKAFGAFEEGTKPIKSSVNAMGDFEKALRRALIVAPVWMVAREAIKQTIDFVKEGIQYYLDTEKAVLNVRTSIMEMGQAGEVNINGLVQRFHELSIETGKAEAGILNIYASVNRILGNTEKSYLAVNAAVRLGEATGVDAAKIAESVAFMYKLQGDSLKGVTTDAQKFQAISELLYATQAKTPGGLEKLITDIRGFSATMNLADFGIENTIKLFGALESSGVTSGTVLRAGVMKVLTNIDEVSKMLGVSIPKNLTPFQAFTLVLEKLGSAMKPGELNTNAFAVMKDIFGTGARGAGQVAALAKDIDSLRTALSGAGASEKDKYLYKKQLSDIENTAQHQIEIFTNLKKQAGEAFVTGIIGGKDFTDALKRLNSQAETSSLVFQALGKSFQMLWSAKNWMTGEAIINQFTASKQKLEDEAKAREDLNTRIMLGLKKQLTAQETVLVAAEAMDSPLLKDQTQRQKTYETLIKIAAEEGKITEEKAKQLVVQEQQHLMAKKQADELENLVLKYAKATPSERKNIRREIELSQMSPESQVSAFQNMSSDRKLLLEMMPRLSEEVRGNIAGIIARESGLNVGGRFGTGATNPYRPGTAMYSGVLEKGQQAISINPKGADTINFTINYQSVQKAKEEVIKDLMRQMEDKLLTDEDFQKSFAKIMGNKL